VSSSGFSSLLLTDPTTGVQTNIFSGGNGKDTASDQSADNTTDDTTLGTGGSSDTFSEKANETAKDNFNDTGAVGIVVQGSPQPGETFISSTQLNLTDNGNDTVNGQDTSSAPGSDSGGDTFQTSANDSIGGKSQSVTNYTVTGQFKCSHLWAVLVAAGC
jgi:hypothetical protein